MAPSQQEAERSAMANSEIPEERQREILDGCSIIPYKNKKTRSLFLLKVKYSLALAEQMPHCCFAADIHVPWEEKNVNWTEHLV